MICIENAVKKYGEHTVLDGVSLTVEAGTVCGLVGRNGSGKTVLLKAICGFTPLTSGRILVRGRQIGKDTDVPEDIGILIETPGFLPNYSGSRNLEFLAGISRRAGKARIREVLELVGLDPWSPKHVQKYSLGMRQRLGIAQALLEDPSLLVLDEPFNGLDNEGVRDMHALFLKLKAAGKTMIMASHSNADIETLCDTVHEMDRGTLRRVR